MPPLGVWDCKVSQYIWKALLEVTIIVVIILIVYIIMKKILNYCKIKESAKQKKYAIEIAKKMDINETDYLLALKEQEL
jgi:uncharacterized membrane protein YcjF (UPF0283 family)